MPRVNEESYRDTAGNWVINPATNATTGEEQVMMEWRKQ